MDRGINHVRSLMTDDFRGRGSVKASRESLISSATRYLRPVSSDWADACRAGVNGISEPLTLSPSPVRNVMMLVGDLAPGTQEHVARFTGVNGTSIGSESVFLHRPTCRNRLFLSITQMERRRWHDATARWTAAAGAGCLRDIRCFSHSSTTD